MPDRQHVLDVARRERIGLDEAVFCEGKSPAQIAAILEETVSREGSMLLTRLGPTQYEALPDALRVQLDHDPVSRTAYLGEVPTPDAPAQVAVVTAGTSDVPVAREAGRTLAFRGVACLDVFDVGVAGLWRLLDRIEELRAMRVVIVVAGMDAALPSVVTGLVAGAVIAVPCSAGYGVAAGGHAALNAALASCAPGLTVVNIDNGYGAASAAMRVLRAARAG